MGGPLGGDVARGLWARNIILYSTGAKGASEFAGRLGSDMPLLAKTRGDSPMSMAATDILFTSRGRSA